MIIQVVVAYICLFALVTKSNPFSYLKCIVPAQTMAFASSSSAATIPMNIRSVLATGRVSEAITRFVVPLGATVNMDGGAIYFPCACIYLAVLNGITPSIPDYILLVIVDLQPLAVLEQPPCLLQVLYWSSLPTTQCSTQQEHHKVSALFLLSTGWWIGSVRLWMLHVMP